MADLTTVEAVKQFMGKADAADDALLASMVAAYSQWVRSFTNRDFNVAAYDIWRSGRDSDVMMLPQWPIQSVEQVVIEGRVIPPASSFGAYGYRFDERQIVLSGARFPIGAMNVNIKFTAGFAVIPADIAQAVNELVSLRYKMRDKQEWVSKSLASETVTLNQRDMPASVATILKQYASKVPL